MNRRAALTVVACALAALVKVEAQAPAATRPQPPTFRAAVQLIEIDVSVTDQQGRFVNNLTKNDFEIVEDGVPQQVISLTLFDLPAEPLPAPAARGEPVERDVVSNLGEGRIYVMLLDCCAPVFGGNSQTGPFWAHRFVEEAIRPNDMMAIVHVQGNVRDGQPLTGSKRLMRESIDRYLRAPGIDFGGDACAQMLRLRNTYEALEDVSERLGNVTGRRKAILWVNADIPFDPSVTFGATGGSTEPCTGASAAGSVAFMHRDAIRAATRHNVAVYPIDPAGLSTTTGFGELQRTAALRTVAEDTGGEAVVGTNNYRPAFDRIVRQNSTYYLLGYYPTTEHRDGRFHNVTVRVKRGGLSVRARRGYFAPTPDAKPADQPIAVENGLSPAGRGALRSPAPVRGLGVELFAAPFKGTGRRAASVVLGAQISGSALRLGAGDRVEISYLPINQQGEIGRGARKVFTLNFTQASRAAIEKTGIRFVDRVDLLPGRHEIRFAVSQTGGATGSVVAQVEVPDFSSGPLTMSGLVLASSRTASHRTVLGDQVVKSALAWEPTAIRRFAEEETISVFGEVYVNAGGMEGLDVTCSIASLSGEVVRTGRAQREGKEQPNGGIRYTAHLPLRGLTPGSYVLIARASSSAKNSTTSRQVPFSLVAE